MSLESVITEEKKKLYRELQDYYNDRIAETFPLIPTIDPNSYNPKYYFTFENLSSNDGVYYEQTDDVIIAVLAEFVFDIEDSEYCEYSVIRLFSSVEEVVEKMNVFLETGANNETN